MNNTNPSCSVIIVTHNSQQHLPIAMDCLKKQTRRADNIVIVDSGSTNLDYLEQYKQEAILVSAKGDIGFCKGNNIGWSKVSHCSDYSFLLNPDAFLTPDYLEKAIAFMEHPHNQRCAALTGTTLGYDIHLDKPTGKYDTTGIFPLWYGGWHERGQGLPFQSGLYAHPEEIPAICGAVFFARNKALQEVLIRGNEILDNNFYMYKEDIDLSLRLRNKGWKLIFNPDLLAYHCRGWNPDRSKMPRKMRLCSAYNELRINARRLSLLGILYSGLKYTAVKTLNI